MWKQFQEKYNLNTCITKVIEEDMKFDKITKVQNVVIPNFLKNRDVIVKACTGSGKTLAYLIPILQRLLQEVKSEYIDETNKSLYVTGEGQNEEIAVEKIPEIKNKILALIILPTRELAMQVKVILLKFIEKIKFSYALLIGGKKIDKDLNRLADDIPNIIVCTPGRIFDLDERLNFQYRDLKVLVLDEADKMLELGYEVKLTYLFGKFPKQRRTGLFSATINSQIENMIKVGMQNPIFVDIKINLDTNKKVSVEEENLGKLNENIFINSVKEPTKDYSKVILVENFNDKKEELTNFTQEVPHQLKQYYIGFDNVQDKFPYLIYLIKNFYNKKSKFMIFFATCNSVEYFSNIFAKLIASIKDEVFENVFPKGVGNELDEGGINIFKLHSKITQKKRNYEYKRFLECENGILLSTDLSARGIDVPNVDLIVQFDPPKNEEIYIHRIGRTARVGREGLSLIFLSNEEINFIGYMKNRKVIIDDIRLDKTKIQEYLGEKNKTNNTNSTNVNSTDEEFISETDLDFTKGNYLTFKNSVQKNLKEINLSDKWLYDKAIKAFISLIRFYKEHDLKYIFDFNKLDIGNIAHSFRLMRLPRLKEIIGKKIENFEQDNSINPKYDLAYMDANVGKQMMEKEERQSILKEERALKKETADIIREQGKRNRTKKEKKQAKNRNTQKDWDDLADETKLYKKYRQGKISKEEYDKIFMNIK